MRAFIMTSSPCELGVPGMLAKNGQISLLRSLFPRPFSMLYICSSPSAHDRTDLYSSEMKATFEEKGFVISRLTTLDDRNAAEAASLIAAHDMVFLSGGHVPTQNAFFHDIALRELLRDYSGVVMSLSAGSMNAARDVYASPEEPGEAIDPAYRRELEGLGLTLISIEPHYQLTRDMTYDGLHNLSRILLPDSWLRDIYCFPDGTYLLSMDGRQTVYGRCDLLRRGQVIRVCEDGGSCPVPVPDTPFQPLDTSFLNDGVIRLQLKHVADRDLEKCWVPAYYFDITLMDGTPVGTCDLRIGNSSRLYYGGHIGYGVDASHRGHHYAARAVCLLKQLARLHHMPYFYITCNVTNIASARTCEAAGGRFIEDAPVPRDHDLYREEGQETVKIYRFDLSDPS